MKSKEEKVSAVEENEFEYDEIRGAHGRKPKMAILNKTKLSRYEMDALFLEEGTSEES